MKIIEFIFTSIAILATFVAFSAAVIFFGCEDQEKCQSIGETRCVDNAIDLCNSSGYWEESVDCSDVVNFEDQDSKLICCYDDNFEGHICLTQEECK